ncbi:helix-turn-helix transcriptional regulator [Phenylobacterium sp.]|uniref:helix-turn-helix transcriptional regulator n=1 Tax=Phenylobacterium sp. TaxID=1871053 RepID=UPI0025D5AD10|nr:helix-turn-helix transcriptional regulator [Phenylobacterium sp.]
MSISVPRRVQEAVAEIYRGILHSPIETFKETTLQGIGALLPYTSAVWGSGVHSSNEMLGMSSVGQPLEGLLSYAARWQSEDFVRAAAVARPGVALRNEDVMPLADYHRTPIYREFSRPSGIEHALMIVEHNAVTDLAEIVALFRSDPEAPFGDEEKALLEHLAPHMVAAWRQSQLAHHYRAAVASPGIGLAGHESYAVTDDRGLVHAAGEHFCLALLDVSPGWVGPRLPAALQDLVGGGRAALQIGDYEFTVRRANERRLFAVSRQVGAFGLTPAETRVARLYAEGLSQRDIALRQGVSAATVRNQIASVYLKLDVHSKLQLLRALNHDG